MTTSLLNEAYDIHGVTHTFTNYEDERVIIAGEMTHDSINCPKCSGQHGIFRGKKIRRFHLPPIGSKKCFFDLTLHRVRCLSCDNLYWPSLSFMQGMKRMSRSFINHAIDLLQFGTIKDVADHLGVGWDCIKELHKEALEKKYENIPISEVIYLSIDEFSLKKGHNYMTVISDLKTGRIIHAVEGRKQKDLEPFLEELKKKP